MISREIATRRRDEVETLIVDNGGTITPQQIVAFATAPTTALHSLFVWDDTVAAQLYRETQASMYLRAAVRLIPRDNDEPLSVRAFVHLSTERGQHVYRPVVDVLSDPSQRDVMIRDALSELNGVRQKYAHLEELALVWDAISSTPIAA